jgi:hypothetical protein
VFFGRFFCCAGAAVTRFEAPQKAGAAEFRYLPARSPIAPTLCTARGAIAGFILCQQLLLPNFRRLGREAIPNQYYSAADSRNTGIEARPHLG